MSEKLLLVGSVPYESAEDVLRAATGALGPYLDTVPDGEVLDRRYWILRMAFQVFNGHPAIETLHRPEAPHGFERQIPISRADSWKFRLRDGFDRLGFDMLGWRLGYAKDAQTSYSLFAALKREGKIRSEARFQVSLPSTNSVCNPSMFGTDMAALATVRAGFQEALVAEVANICRLIPAAELAIQFDCSWEITDVHGKAGLPIEGSIERNLSQFDALTAPIHAEAQLGFHLCFGTFGGWPRFAPANLGRTVEFANAVIATAPRRVDWMHMPALNTTEDAFYAPLKALQAKEVRIYLGLVHSMDSFEDRYRVARRHLPEFGLGAYCGLGRLEPGDIPGCFEDHLRAVQTAKRIKAS